MSTSRAGELFSRYARFQGHRLNEVAAEILGLCDQALLSDDPGSAGMALDRVRALAADLGAQGHELLAVGAPRVVAVEEAHALSYVATVVSRLVAALLDQDPADVRVQIPARPPHVLASTDGITRDVVEWLLTAPDLRAAHLEVEWTPQTARVDVVVDAPPGVPGLTLTLPLLEPHGPGAAPPPQPQARWRRALVAEDNEALRDLMVQALLPLFEEIVAVEDGDDALSRLAALGGEVDALVMDLRMPRRGGLEAMRVALGRWPRLRVVVVSGAASDADVRGAASVGAAAFLIKPFSLAELRGAVQDALAASVPGDDPGQAG